MNVSKRPDGRKALGAFGERQAAEYLAAQGYSIVHTNWRLRSGELDIVARLGETWIFAEVRTRRMTGRFGTPQESVNAGKIQQVRATAAAYVHAHGLHHSKIRFDVVAIELDRDGLMQRIDHIPNAF